MLKLVFEKSCTNYNKVRRVMFIRKHLIQVNITLFVMKNYGRITFLRPSEKQNNELCSWKCLFSNAFEMLPQWWFICARKHCVTIAMHTKPCHSQLKSFLETVLRYWSSFENHLQICTRKGSYLDDQHSKILTWKFVMGTDPCP